MSDVDMNLLLSKDEKFSTVRTPHMVENIVFIDGQEGCGKTLFSSLISAFDRVEKLTYSYEIEQICSLHLLNKIDTDAAVTMIRMISDTILYNTMMSREVNCRPSDLSSIFKDINTFSYIKRMFNKGEMEIPDLIKKEKPILALTVHKLLSIADPVLEAFKDRVTFIEIVRHPLYMIIQQSLNNQRLINDVRDFVIYYKKQNKEYPWYTVGWEKQFENANPVEKSIYYVQKIGDLTEISKKKLVEKYNAKILTIPFENFVIKPWPYMKQIESILSSKITKKTQKMMKKQNVPRNMVANGIPLAIYKRCGWEPPKQGSTEKDELDYRRQFAADSASKEAMNILDDLCQTYEAKYLNQS